MMNKEERGYAPRKLLGTVAMLALPLLIACTSGCVFWTPERIAAIHAAVATALETAYETGGSKLVTAKLDELAADGKITPEQAADLKRAAQHGYDAFLARLRELSDVKK